MPQQIDPAAIQTLIALQAMARPAGPLHLSLGVSIELSKVVRYEPLEQTEIVTEGEGKNRTEVEKGTGVFDPAILMDSGDYMILTEEQNELFRKVWNVYSRISHESFELASQVFGTSTAEADTQATGQ
jgi:hypothetical protein